MPYYKYECERCGFEQDVARSIADIEIVPDEYEAPECDHSEGHKWERLLSRTSFLSTERHVGFNEFKQDTNRQQLIEAAQLEKTAAGLPHDKRADIKKEIKSLRSARKDGE